MLKRRSLAAGVRFLHDRCQGGCAASTFEGLVVCGDFGWPRFHDSGPLPLQRGLQAGLGSASGDDEATHARIPPLFRLVVLCQAIPKIGAASLALFLCASGPAPSFCVARGTPLALGDSLRVALAGRSWSAANGETAAWNLALVLREVAEEPPMREGGAFREPCRATCRGMCTWMWCAWPLPWPGNGSGRVALRWPWVIPCAWHSLAARGPRRTARLRPGTWPWFFARWPKSRRCARAERSGSPAGRPAVECALGCGVLGLSRGLVTVLGAWHSAGLG